MNETHERETMAIGDFAGRVGLSISAVRFYCDRDLLTPVEIDPDTGYRRFGIEQVALGVLIRDLRRIGMSLRDIDRAIASSPDERSAFVDAHVAGLEQQASDARSIAAQLGSIRSPERTRTTIASSVMAQAIRQVLPAAGVDPAMPQFMGVLVEVKSGSVRFVATDSHRLAVRDVVALHAGDECSVVIAATTLAKWLRILEAGPARIVELTTDRDDVVIVHGDDELRTRAVPVRFPAYEHVLGTYDDGGHSIVVNQRVLLDALERFTPPEAISLATSGESLTMRCRESNLEVPIESSDTTWRLSCNPGYAADAVRHAVGGDVMIQVGGPMDPILFRSADDGTYSSLLMPVLQV